MMDEASGGTLRVEVDDVLAGDRYVTIFLNITAHRHGERMSVVVAQFAEVDEHGRWSRCWFLPDKLDEWNRFFAGAKLREPLTFRWMSGLRGVVLTVRFLCELAMLVAPSHVRSVSRSRTACSSRRRWR
jgi:hypothetical protein